MKRVFRTTSFLDEVPQEPRLCVPHPSWSGRLARDAWVLVNPPRGPSASSRAGPLETQRAQCWLGDLVEVRRQGRVSTQRLEGEVACPVLGTQSVKGERRNSRLLGKRLIKKD